MKEKISHFGKKFRGQIQYQIAKIKVLDSSLIKVKGV